MRVEIGTDEGAYVVEHWTPETVAREANAPGRVHIVIATFRPKFLGFATMVEVNCFPCRTERGKLLRLIVVEWLGMPWGVMSFPINDLPAVQKIAAGMKLRIADGVPHALEGNDDTHFIGARREGDTKRSMKIVEVFPFNSPSVFTLEPDHGSPGPHVGGLSIHAVPDPDPKRN